MPCITLILTIAAQLLRMNNLLMERCITSIQRTNTKLIRAGFSGGTLRSVPTSVMMVPHMMASSLLAVKYITLIR